MTSSESNTPEVPGDQEAAVEALRESEERYRRLVEASPDAIAVNSGGRLVFVNEAAARLLGASSPEELIGRPILDIVHPDYHEIVLDRVRREHQGETVPLLEEKFIRLDGTIIDVEVAGMPVTYQGKPGGQIVVRDITDRKRAEEILRATIESTADGILVVDNDGLTIHANARFAQMWRIPLELLATKSDELLLEFVLDQLVDPKAFLDKVKDLYRTDEEALDTLEFKDGRMFERYSRPLVSQGQLAGRVWSFRDITEQKAKEDQLREAEAKFRTLVEQIPAVSYIDAAEGPTTTLYISPQTESMLGFTPEEWMADPALLSKRIHPDDKERWIERNAESDASGRPFRLEYRILARDGRIVWVRDASLLVRDELGKPRFWQGVMFDITERKLAEDALRQALDREKEAASRLRTLDDMKNMFLSAVSHELRTPLSVVLGVALTLEGDEFPPGERPDLIRRLAANARKLDRLLSDLLDVDRMARGILEPRRRPTDVGELVRQVVAGSEALAGRPVEVHTQEVVVAVDGPKVERIVENLLANAVRHTRDGGRVWVRAAPERGGVLITVEDEGPGIPSDFRETIFEPFRQGPNPMVHSPGVGIGLTLVSRFAELHGGRAWVDDRTGGGSSFRVFLPPANDPADEVPPEEAEASLP